MNWMVESCANNEMKGRKMNGLNGFYDLFLL